MEIWPMGLKALCSLSQLGLWPLRVQSAIHNRWLSITTLHIALTAKDSGWLLDHGIMQTGENPQSSRTQGITKNPTIRSPLRTARVLYFGLLLICPIQRNHLTNTCTFICTPGDKFLHMNHLQRLTIIYACLHMALGCQWFFMYLSLTLEHVNNSVLFIKLQMGDIQPILIIFLNITYVLVFFNTKCFQYFSPFV